MEDLTGKQFGNLTVLGLSKKQKKGHRRWSCRCICGRIAIEVTGKLKYGHRTSCGCMRRSRAKSLHKCGKEHKGWCGHGDISGSVWNRIKSCAKYRRKEFGITIEYAWSLFCKQQGLCAISRVPIKLASSSEELTAGKNTASLDRTDSSKGYVAGNVQWVHVIVNYMKQRLEQQEFIDWCRRIVNAQTN